MAIVSAIAAIAWLLAANHCAVAALMPARAVAANGHEHCPGHEAPAKNNHGESMECCKTLSATAPVVAKDLVGYGAADFQSIDLPSAVPSPLRHQHETTRCEWDTGPPRVSFAELVLQRSLLAHAPPSFA